MSGSPKKITKTSELPSWFKNREYKKQLSASDWYREIRLRHKLEAMASPLLEKEKDREHMGLPRNTEPFEFILEKLEGGYVRPDSTIYHLTTASIPILPLTAGEAIFLGFAARRNTEQSFFQKYETLLNHWDEYVLKGEQTGISGRTTMFGVYERELAKFAETFKDFEAIVNQPIEESYELVQNPFLSYGKPLNGFPVTIDTQFDDQTILQEVKNWLAEVRTKEGTKARRPFKQSDFDDWEYYKIREIFDLETWATINNSKIIDRVLAQALWPNAPDDFSPIDVLRTTARKKTKAIISDEVVVRFYNQLASQHGENFLLQ